MKHIVTILLILNCLFTFGQINNERTFFQTDSKSHLYYVDLSLSNAMVYRLGTYWNKAGAGYLIRNTDTLTKQSDGSYIGQNIKIERENNKLYLVTELKKTKRLSLDTVKNLEIINNNLNNAYYLGRYFEMTDEIYKAYPLYHSLGGGFYTWKGLQNKVVDYLLFREYADKRLKEVKDSISQIQDRYVSLTNYLTKNIRSLDYYTLKDSLIKLPAEYKFSSEYYSSVVNEVAKQRPEYFFRLAEDLPEHRNLIFGAVEDNNEVIQGLESVEGHKEIKKEFFKDRRFGKTLPYKMIGMYVILAGIITLVIVR